MVIPTVRLDADFVAAVRSVQVQTLSEFEIVVVLDGIDDTEGVVPHDPRIRCVVLGSRSGTSAALNAGIAAASSDLIARLDADDLAVPDRLAQQVASFRSRPDLVLLGSAGTLIDAAGEERGPLDVPSARCRASCSGATRSCTRARCSLGGPSTLPAGTTPAARACRTTTCGSGWPDSVRWSTHPTGWSATGPRRATQPSDSGPRSRGLGGARVSPAARAPPRTTQDRPARRRSDLAGCAGGQGERTASPASSRTRPACRARHPSCRAAGAGWRHRHDTIDVSLDHHMRGALADLRRSGFGPICLVSRDTGRLGAVAEREGVASVAVPMEREIMPVADLRALARLIALHAVSDPRSWSTALPRPRSWARSPRP